MKVIFLDIDGVLNVIPQGFDDYGAIFHHHFIDNLKRIIDETDAVIVISSSWRMDGIDAMKNMWSDRNYPGEVIDITPHCNILINEGLFSFFDEVARGDEIQYWLDRNDVENYVILDDDTDMLDSQMHNFVRTSNNTKHSDCVDLGYGLTDICTTKAIKILNGK